MIENRSISSNIIWNYIGTFFILGTNIIILPLLLKFLDSDELGIWYVMTGYANLSTLFSFGFTPAFARNIAYCWNGASKLKKEGKYEGRNLGNTVDYNLFYKILASSKIIYFFLAIVALISIGIFGTFHIIKISKEIISQDLIASWIVFLVAMVVNLYYGYYDSYLIGIGYVKKSNQIRIIASIIRIVTMFTLMVLGMKLLAAAIAFLLFGIVYRVLCKRAFFSVHDIKEGLGLVDNKRILISDITECVKIVWYNAWRDGFVLISNYLQTQASTLVMSMFLSLSEIAVFSLTTQLITVIANVSISIYNANTPNLQKAYITGDKKELRNIQSFCLMIFFIVFCVGVFLLIFIGVPVLKWIKPDAALSSAFILVYAIYEFMVQYRNCYGRYLSATNRVIYWKSYIITGTVTVIIYTLLLKYYNIGIYGIVIVSMLAEGSYNFWKWPGLVIQELNLTFLCTIKLGYKRLKELIRSGV